MSIELRETVNLDLSSTVHVVQYCMMRIEISLLKVSLLQVCTFCKKIHVIIYMHYVIVTWIFTYMYNTSNNIVMQVLYNHDSRCP